MRVASTAFAEPYGTHPSSGKELRRTPPTGNWRRFHENVTYSDKRRSRRLRRIMTRSAGALRERLYGGPVARARPAGGFQRRRDDPRDRRQGRGSAPCTAARCRPPTNNCLTPRRRAGRLRKRRTVVTEIIANRYGTPLRAVRRGARVAVHGRQVSSQGLSHFWGRYGWSPRRVRVGRPGARDVSLYAHEKHGEGVRRYESAAGSRARG
jgi:hypothetical protein